MASSEVEMERNDGQLKHLGFVRILATNATFVVWNLYVCAKQSSGPLKSAVGKVEDAVTAVVSPVYEKFKGVPGDVLVFLDKKVDEATYKIDEFAPPAAKSAVLKAQSIVKKASDLVVDVAEEAKVQGPLAAVSHAGKISKDFAVSQLAVMWYKTNQYPAVHGVLEMAVPTAAHWSEKYNNLVNNLTAKGYSFCSYVPLVPVEELEKAYEQVEAAAGRKVDASSLSDRESDEE